MKNELKRYIKEINKGLHLPHKMKKRITTKLLSEIYGRIDDGEELNSVLTSIGTPQELVEELEANYEHSFKLERNEKNIFIDCCGCIIDVCFVYC